MRELLARWFVAGVGLLILALSVLFGRIQREPSDRPLAVASEIAVPDAGEMLFREARCTDCHSIGDVGNQRYPLDGVGARLDTAALRLWIVAPRAMDPAVRKPSYGDLSPAAVDSLVGYLSRLRG